MASDRSPPLRAANPSAAWLYTGMLPTPRASTSRRTWSTRAWHASTLTPCCFNACQHAEAVAEQARLAVLSRPLQRLGRIRIGRRPLAASTSQFQRRYARAKARIGGEARRRAACIKVVRW